MQNLHILRVEVRSRQGVTAHDGWIRLIHQSGFESMESCASARLFFFYSDLGGDQVQALAGRLLADSVTEEFVIAPVDTDAPPPDGWHTIEVTLLPGVTDPVAESLARAAAQLGFPPLRQVATGQMYSLQGQLSHADLTRLATQVFSNPVIQRYEIDRPIQPPFTAFSEADGAFEVIPLCDADDNRLLAISAERRLSLNLDEMRAIRACFVEQNREPTDVELEMLAQTWSEHCVHKTFKANIDYVGPLPGESGEPVRQRVEGLLNSAIRAATERIDKPWVRSAFVDNAGIIAFDDQWDIAFKVETHNHPSALEPFGGSNTGVGGVIRDVLGVSARPIANTDVLCFGPQDLPDSQLPAGVLHPRRIADGVVRGIEDYGNKIGIPTINGAIAYAAGYTSNPLVFCGCLGLLPRDLRLPGVHKGDLIVVLGGRTGRDGLRGATFSSMEMDHETAGIAGSAVQIGHPINEKQVLEVILRARDEGLYNAITDCGAGGLSSAVGEMAAKSGGTVHLERVPLKYPGLVPWEIWLSEAQERMVLAVPPEHWTRFEAICAIHGIEAVSIGEFGDDGRLRLFFGDRRVGEMDTGFLFDGIPVRHLDARWEPAPAQPVTYPRLDIAADLLALLAHPDIRSKEEVIRRYDHEIQGGGAVKPLVGAAGHGPGDAAVIVPQGAATGGVTRGVVLSAGICPAYTELDPYAMAWAAVDEALRNAVAVGADPDQVALLDNFCWGSPDLPDRLGGLVRCAQGCHDAAIAYGAPFISGKDSLNNEYSTPDGTRHAIPGTLLISAVGIVPDVGKTATMDLKQPGDILYLIGETRAELGGSHYHMLHGLQGGTAPQPDSKAIQTMRALHQAMQSGLVAACHDCSEGGLAVALAEMCIAGRLGATVDLKGGISSGFTGEADTLDRAALFAETTGRFIVEVDLGSTQEFKNLFGDLPCYSLGHVNADRSLDLWCYGEVMRIPTADLEGAWRGEMPPSPAEPAAHQHKPSNTSRKAPALMTPPRVLILHARGSNRDHDAAQACVLAGGQPEIVTLNELVSGSRSLLDYAMLVVPGGFSFGDDLGAGTLWALALRESLGEDMRRFIEGGRPVLGICNGFQALVKAGLLPGPEFLSGETRTVTLTNNESGRFECRWVYIKPNPASKCLFTEGLDDLITCPVAHGEGRIAAREPAVLDHLKAEGLVALTYVDAAGSPAAYPANPNGSARGIAGLTNKAGNILGLMPHPENHIFPWQHPRRHRGEGGMTGLRLFENGLKHP